MIHWATNVRLLVPALLVLLVVPQISLKRDRLLLLAPVLCVWIVTMGQLTAAFARYGRDIEDLHQVIGKMEPNRRYLGLMAERDAIFDPLLKGPLWRHSQLLAQARLGGYTPRGFGNEATPVRWRRQTPFTYEDGSAGFDYAHYGRFYDYILTVQRVGKLPPALLPGAEQQFARIGAAGRFAVYARKR